MAWVQSWLRSEWRRTLPRRAYVFTVVGLACWLLGAAICTRTRVMYTAVGRYQQELGAAGLMSSAAGWEVPPQRPELVVEAAQSHEQISGALERLSEELGLGEGLVRNERIQQWATLLRSRLTVQAWHDATAGSLQLSIRVLDADPQRAARLVEALAEQYADRFIRRPQLAAQRTWETAARSAEEARQRAEAAQRAWERVVEQRLTDGSAGTPRAASAPETAPTDTEATPTPGQSLPVDSSQALHQQLAQSKAQRHRLLATMTPLHPLVRDVERTIAELEQELAMLAAIQPAAPPVAAPAIVPEPAPSVAVNGAAELEWQQAHRDFQTKKRQFELAREASEAAEATEKRAWQLQQGLAQMRLAVLEAPRSPRTPDTSARAWLMAIVTAGSLGVGAVISKAALVGQSIFWNVRQIERNLGLPILGRVTVPGPRTPHIHALPYRRLAVLVRTAAEIWLVAALVALLWLVATQEGFAARIFTAPWQALSELVNLALSSGG